MTVSIDFIEGCNGGYTQTNTPPQGDNSQNIATTQFVNNFSNNTSVSISNTDGTLTISKPTNNSFVINTVSGCNNNIGINACTLNGLTADQIISSVQQTSSTTSTSSSTTSSVTVNQAYKQSFVTSGTFTIPSGISLVFVTGCGGGGGGGVYGGGGGASVIKVPFNVTPGQNISITIGSGGAGQTSSGNPTNGGNTSFGTYLVLNGGQSGGTFTDTLAPVSPTGQGGQIGFGFNGGNAALGYGGNSVFGLGGSPFNGSSSFGGGGGGGLNRTTFAEGETGGNGGSGFILVEW
jgi:hypothetical protein